MDLSSFPRVALGHWPTPLEDARRLTEALGEALEDGADAIGEGCGVPTEDMWAALRMFARTEGVMLDPVYTGKAAAKLVARAPREELPTVFVHTGGLPGLYGYLPDAVTSART